MSFIYKLMASAIFFMTVVTVGFSQQVFKGKIVDAGSKEPIAGLLFIVCSTIVPADVLPTQ